MAARVKSQADRDDPSDADISISTSPSSLAYNPAVPVKQSNGVPVSASVSHSFPTLSPAALRRFRGFGGIDRIWHCGHVYVLKRSPSSISSSLWKLRTAALTFGAITLYRVSTSASSSSSSPRSPFLCIPTSPSVVESESISLNYACLDVVGWDAAAGLFVLRLLADTHKHKTILHSPSRRWFVLGFTAKEECRAWIECISASIAHNLYIYYNGDNVKVRLREPVEPALPVTRSTLQLLPRGYKGGVELVPRYESGDGESEGEKLVERKLGEWREGGGGATGQDEREARDVPVAFTLRFSSLPCPVSLQLTPSPYFAALDLPPAAHLSPLLDRLYHNKVGFGCLTQRDRQLEQRTHSSLLFGEVLFPGVTKLMDSMHLDGRREARGGWLEGSGSGVSVVDLGSGVGKLCVQVWLQYEWVQRVEGVELAVSRFGLGQQALLELVKGDEGTGGEGGRDGEGEPTISRPGGGQKKLQPFSPYVLLHSTPTSISIASTLPSLSSPSSAISPAPNRLRTVTFTRGNLFHCRSALTADIVIIETLILPDSYALLSRLLERCKPGMRLLTFGDVRGLWGAGCDEENVRVRKEAVEKRRRDRGAEPGSGGGVGMVTDGGEGDGGGGVNGEDIDEEEELLPLRYSECPFVHLEANQSKLDRFLTSWSQKKGHYFFLWEKVK